MSGGRTGAAAALPAPPIGCTLRPRPDDEAPPVTTRPATYPIDHLYKGHALDPAALAVEDGARGLSYAELVARVDALAAGLQTLFPAPGARIGVCAYNTIEHMVAVLGIYAAEHVWVALNPRNGNPELDAIIAATRPQAIIADENCLEHFTAGETPVILGRSEGAKAPGRSIADLISEHVGSRPVRRMPSLEAPQTIKFTGGSSGQPKGVIQPYRVVAASVASYLKLFGFERSDRNLCAAPLTHGSAHYVLPIFSVGGSHLLVDRPKAPALIDAFEHGGCTTAFMPPTMIYNMLNEPGLRARDFGSVRHLHYGAAPMVPERITQARQVFNNGLEVIYGQTEAPMLITGMTAAEFADARNLTSVGQASPLMEVRIVSPEGEVLQAGEMGEIVCRGPLVMTGYLDMPEETTKTIVDGWLHTGDAGLLDERGYLYIKDRIRDVIISGGFNVYPSDVEAALAEHPAVRECIVFSVPDEKWGERVEAALSLAPGRSFDERAILGFLRQRIGPVKTPERLHVADELPRSAVGKVLRREAQRLFGDT
jgi:acyl-CoA synthetase (AMP-forming)/AMP-acid ligase II